MQKSVDIQCPDCSGFGIQRYSDSPKKLGVVCGECCGTGKKVLWYKPFTSRRKRQGIDQVTQLANGALGFGSFYGPRIPYTHFLAGKMPSEAIKTVSK